MITNSIRGAAWPAGRSTRLGQLLALTGQFWPQARELRALIVAVMALTLLTPLAATAMLKLLQLLIDNVFVARSIQALPWLATLYLMLAGAKLIAEYFDTCLDARISERIAQRVRIRLYEQLLNQSACSAGAKPVGDQLAHLNDDCERVAALVYGVPVALFAHLAQALCFIVLLCYLSVALTLCALLVVPLIAWSAWRIAPRIRRCARIARQQATRWLSLAEQRLQATAMVQSFDAVKFESVRFERATDVARRAELRTVDCDAGLKLLIGALTVVATIAVMLVAALQVSDGAMTSGAVLAFLAGLASLYEPVRGMGQQLGRLQRAQASAQRVAGLLAQPAAVAQIHDAHHLGQADGSITLDNVHYSYPDGHAALAGVSFAVTAGQTVALVGPSGCGKSTLIRLLARLHDPQRGRILLDGYDLRGLSLSSLRQAVTPVFQEATLFSGSIAQNIRYNQSLRAPQQIQALAESTRICAFADQSPLQLGTPVGARGARLSGGQRQRIALARALLRDSPVLLLDEATGGIDSETEELIHSALFQRTGLRTTLIVAHRLSTLKAASHIVVMEHGRIVESCAPAQLLREGTRCHTLFANQIEP